MTLSGSVSDPNLSSGGVAGSGVSDVQITLYALPPGQGGLRGVRRWANRYRPPSTANVWSVAYPLYDAEPNR